MFRKLVHLVAATVATTSLLAVAATPASAEEPSTLTITIGYGDGSLPSAGGSYHVDGDGLVASIKGTLDGEPVDATSCAVSATSLDAVLSGGVATVASCGDAAGIAARLTPYTDAAGGIGTGGDVSTDIIRWEIRGKCKVWYVFGFPAVVECEVTVTAHN